MRLALGVWGSEKTSMRQCFPPPPLAGPGQACTLSPRPSKQEEDLPTRETLETGPRSNIIYSI